MDFKKKTYLLLLGIALISNSFFGQGRTDMDTSRSNNPIHSCKKATLLSTIIPGAGQVYNGNFSKKKLKNWFWKVPIIYGGFTALAISINRNLLRYNTFKRYLNAIDDSTPSSYTKEYGIFFRQNDERRLRDIKNYYRRNMEFSIILAAGLYALQIVDANVEAHLMGFEKIPLTKTTAFSLNPSFRHGNQLGFGFNFKVTARNEYSNCRLR